MDNERQIAVTHYYLTTGIMEGLSSEGVVSHSEELMGDGQVELIDALYDYAVILTEAWKSLSHLHDDMGIFDYEVSEDLAAQMFIALSKRAKVLNPKLEDNYEMPCHTEWAELCKKVITYWAKDTPGLSESIEFMVHTHEKE